MAVADTVQLHYITMSANDAQRADIGQSMAVGNRHCIAYRASTWPSAAEPLVSDQPHGDCHYPNSLPLTAADLVESSPLSNPHQYDVAGITTRTSELLRRMGSKISLG